MGFVFRFLLPSGREIGPRIDRKTDCRSTVQCVAWWRVRIHRHANVSMDEHSNWIFFLQNNCCELSGSCTRCDPSYAWRWGESSMSGYCIGQSAECSRKGRFIQIPWGWQRSGGCFTNIHSATAAGEYWWGVSGHHRESTKSFNRNEWSEYD